MYVVLTHKNVVLFFSQVRYQSRKKLAEQRPRVRGQFVRKTADGTNDNDIKNAEDSWQEDLYETNTYEPKKIYLVTFSSSLLGPYQQSINLSPVFNRTFIKVWFFDITSTTTIPRNKDTTDIWLFVSCRRMVWFVDSGQRSWFMNCRCCKLVKQ